ncbi:hypothetical protein ROMU108268_17075 [Roseomonas mucosa]
MASRSSRATSIRPSTAGTLPGRSRRSPVASACSERRERFRSPTQPSASPTRCVLASRLRKPGRGRCARCPRVRRSWIFRERSIAAPSGPGPASVPPRDRARSSPVTESCSGQGPPRPDRTARGGGRSALQLSGRSPIWASPVAETRAPRSGAVTVMGPSEMSGPLSRRGRSTLPAARRIDVGPPGARSISRARSSAGGSASPGTSIASRAVLSAETLSRPDQTFPEKVPESCACIPSPDREASMGQSWAEGRPGWVPDWAESRPDRLPPRASSDRARPRKPTSPIMRSVPSPSVCRASAGSASCSVWPERMSCQTALPSRSSTWRSSTA